MGRRGSNNRTQLTRGQQDQLFRAIWDSLDPNGSPIRLAEIVEVARGATELGTAWDFYLLVSDELQRAKRAGAVALVKGRGGGWIRADRTEATGV